MMIRFSNSLVSRVLATAGLVVCVVHAAEPTSVDICVYGGTSGAVAAAVQAVRMQKTVVLISPDRNLGGMTSGGLGWTDIGDERILGGLSHEFFNKLYLHYQKDEAWNFQPKATYKNAGQGSPAMNHKAKTMSVFEPKVAEAAFEEWVKENKIPVVRARLDRSKGSVVMTGKSIASLRTEDGRVFKAKMFVDATYEGDLMAMAGVTYTLGREPNSKYDETINGIQPGHKGNQLPRGIDPYVVKGTRASGLLPGVNANVGGELGQGDNRLQAYCYRMCLTNHEPNRIMIQKPEGYDEKDYEIVFRAIEVGQKDRFFKLSPIANYKTDSNNDSGASTDFIGKNYDYPEADYATREKIAKAHENYQRGLVWTLQNHPRVPEELRKKYGPWGLPKDEFKDNNNWAHALYVREARRMVGDYVVTQHEVANSAEVHRSIGMGAYMMDSHQVQRYVTPEGDVQNEGDIQSRIKGPYKIDYGSVIPKKGECDNLFVTFCVSASHMAFGSIRMEPVLMVLSQSAVTAGAIAIDRKIAVQDVPYDVLQARLIADGQRLELAIPTPAADPTAPPLVLDNESPKVKVSGEWETVAAHEGFYGANYLHDANQGKGDKSVTYDFEIKSARKLPVYVKWVSNANRASNVPVEITSAKGRAIVEIDQRKNGGTWMLLGEYDFTPASGARISISNKGTNGFVIVDAVGLGKPGETVSKP